MSYSPWGLKESDMTWVEMGNDIHLENIQFESLMSFPRESAGSVAGYMGLRKKTDIKRLFYPFYALEGTEGRK